MELFNDEIVEYTETTIMMLAGKKPGSQPKQVWEQFAKECDTNPAPWQFRGRAVWAGCRPEPMNQLTTWVNYTPSFGMLPITPRVNNFTNGNIGLKSLCETRSDYHASL